MELSNLIIYKIIIFYVPQKNRVIKKKYYKKIGIIKNVPNKKITQTTIELYKRYNNGYIIVDSKYDDDYYYTKLNNKSIKQYNELKKNKQLQLDNIDIKKDYFIKRYNTIITDNKIVFELLKDIDIM